MSLHQLKISTFRNIASYDGEFSLDFNLIAGQNGSGKTSLLEAIYFLGHAKSFRTHMANQLVQHAEEGFILFAKVSDGQDCASIGIERLVQQPTRIKLNGQYCYHSSALASVLPIQVLNPDSYKILEAGPKYRRQFLDWGLFHVEQRFLGTWKRFQRGLEQRNRALNEQRSTSEVIIWDTELASDAEKLHDFRQCYFDQLQDILIPLLSEHAVLKGVHSRYQRGWSMDFDYATALQGSLKRDRQLRYTSIGPQRADLVFLLEGRPVEEVLSRGQQKIFLSFLSLAQGILCRQQAKKTCLYLFDDLPSELDQAHQAFLLEQLAALKSQVFITGINPRELQSLVGDFSHKMFHVEHGQITCQSL